MTTIYGGDEFLLSPEITSVSPDYGWTGDTVTINGNSFGYVQGASTVTVGGVSVTVVSWTTDEIVILLPTMAGGAYTVEVTVGGESDSTTITGRGNDMIVRIVDGIGGGVLLDLNDEVGYFYTDGSKFPLPEVIYSEVENSLVDGKRMSAWRLGGRKITLMLYLQGTSIADLKTKRDVLFRWLTKSCTLEVRNWGEASSVFYTTWPVLPQLPDYSEKYIKDEFAETDVTIEIPVDSGVKKSLEEVVVYENVAPNGACEYGSGGSLDDWTFTEDGVNSFAGQTDTYAYDGDYCVGLSTQNDAVAAMITTDFIDIIPYHHWQFDCRAAYPPGGSSTVTMSILCYDAGDNLLDEITVVSAALDGAAEDDDWYMHALKNGATEGVIYPVGTGSAVEWPVGTTQAKLNIEGTSAALKGAQIDAIMFGDTEYIAGHKMESAFTVALDNISGVLPADMWLYLDKVYKQASTIFVGQSKDYHPDKSLVRKPADGDSTVDDPNCLGMSYEQYDPPVNGVSTPGFEAPGGFAEDNTDNFTNWAETRTSTPGTSYIGATSNAHWGSWALMFYNDGSGEVNGNLLSDAYAVDTAEDYYWEVYTDCDAFAPLITIEVEFHDGVGLISTKTLYQGPPTGCLGFWDKISGWFYSADIPASATHYKIKITGLLEKSKWGYGYYLAIDDVYCGPCANGGLVEFPIESHEGRYLDMALVSVEQTAELEFEIEMRSRVISDALGPISETTVGSVCDVGNPQEIWACTALKDYTFDKAVIPSAYISELADTSLLSERAQLMLPSDFGARDFYNQAIIRVPLDRAIVRLNNLIDEEYIILSNEGVFKSLDGTLDLATPIDSNKVNPPALSIKADPNGINLVVAAFSKDGNSYLSLPIFNIKLQYYPAYLL